MAHIHEKLDFTVAIFVVHDGKVLLHPSSQARQNGCRSAGTSNWTKIRSAAALREAKEESGPRRGIARRTSAHDFAWHARSTSSRRAFSTSIASTTRTSTSASIYWARLAAPVGYRRRKAAFQPKPVLATEEHHDIRWCFAGELDKVLQLPMTDAGEMVLA